MAKDRKITQLGYLILSLIILLFLAVALLMMASPPQTLLGFLIRLLGLWGLAALAVAAIITPFLKEIKKVFGRSFLGMHHFFSFAGLILITLHPVSAALQAMDLSVFVPVFDSWTDFWIFAGRPALYILYIALIAVLIRRKVKPWRAIHALMYVVLLFGFVHGTYIGTDFAASPVFVIFSVLFGLAVISFLAKRVQQFKIKGIKRLDK